MIQKYNNLCCKAILEGWHCYATKKNYRDFLKSKFCWRHIHSLHSKVNKKRGISVNFDYFPFAPFLILVPKF